jgi:hypothetical protein
MKSAKSRASKQGKGPTYFISYGFLGGAGHSRRLRRLLTASGYHPAKSMNEADIIIAHSAGCLLLEAHVQAKLILLIGMPLADGPGWRTFIRATQGLVQKHFLKWPPLALSSAFHGLTQLQRSLMIATNIKKLPLPEHDTHIIFIANRYDPWPKSRQLDELLDKKLWAFASLPGIHDDIYVHPEHYTAIINHYGPDILATTKQ